MATNNLAQDIQQSEEMCDDQPGEVDASKSNKSFFIAITFMIALWLTVLVTALWQRA